MICPADYTYCVDDLCVTTCIRTGTDPLRKCDRCGQIIDDENPSISDCICDDDLEASDD